jgi:hypothetical protein
LLQQAAAGFWAASQELQSFFVAQEARKREAEARVTERIRIIVTEVGWERYDYEALAFWPSAYLVAWIGAGGGGGGGLEAQETRPPAMTEAARARRAYFIVWCSLCLLLFTRPVDGAHGNWREVSIQREFANG